MDLTPFICIIVLLFFLFAFILLRPKNKENPKIKKAIPKDYVFQNNCNKNPDLTRKQRRLLKIKRRTHVIK